MELALIIGAILIATTVCGVLAYVVGTKFGAGSAQIAGQLQAMISAQAAQQAGFDEKLSSLSNRINDRLLETAASTGNHLNGVVERLAGIDAAQRNITELSKGVVGLQDILSNKQARGAFGEIQLMDLVKETLAPSQYEFQATLTNGKRVDCLIKLPTPPGSIAVDAKFPLEAYRLIQAAKTDETLTAANREFTSAIRAHIKAIAEKYIVAGETADSALMFLPSEAVYAEIHGNFQNLVEEAMRAKVWIVSPTTMMATLTTMRAILKDVRMREQAGAIKTHVAGLKIELERLEVRAGELQRHYEQGTEDLRKVGISVDKALKRCAQIENVGLEDQSYENPEAMHLEKLPAPRLAHSA